MVQIKQETVEKNILFYFLIGIILFAVIGGVKAVDDGENTVIEVDGPVKETVSNIDETDSSDVQNDISGEENLAKIEEVPLDIIDKETDVQIVSKPENNDKIVVIINKKNPVDVMTVKDLKDIYKFKKTKWINDDIQVFLPPSGSKAMAFLVDDIFNVDNERGVDKYYIYYAYKNNIGVTHNHSLNTKEAVQKVSNDKSAIAIVPFFEIIEDKDKVKILEVE